MGPERDAILKALEHVIDPELRGRSPSSTWCATSRSTAATSRHDRAHGRRLPAARRASRSQVAEHVGAVAGRRGAVRLGFDVMSARRARGADDEAARRRRRADEGHLRRPRTRVLAVASGKGGVGKSSLTANLAAAFSAARPPRRRPRRGHLRPLDPAHARRSTSSRSLVDKMIVPPVKRRPEADVDRLLPRRQRAGDVARADAAPRARAVPVRTSTGASSTCCSSTCRRAPATSRSRSASCCRGRRRSSSRRRSRWRRRSPRGRRDGAEDEHAAARRDREHDLRGVRLRRRRAARGASSAVPLLGSVPLDARAPRVGRRRASRSSSPTRSRRRPGDRRDRRGDRTARPAGVQGRCRLAPERRRVDATSARARLLRADAATLADHFLDAERRGKRGHGCARIEWLETLTSSTRRAAGAGRLRAGLRALGRRRRARLPDAGGDLRRAARASRPRTRGSSSRRHIPDRDARLLDAAARRRRPRRGADRDLAAAARAIPTAAPSWRGRTRSRSPSRARTASRSSPTSRWATSPTATSSPGTARPRSSFRSAASRPTRRSRSRSGSSCSSTRSAGEEHGAVLVVARPEPDPVPALRNLPGPSACPGMRGPKPEAERRFFRRSGLSPGATQLPPEVTCAPG